MGPCCLVGLLVGACLVAAAGTSPGGPSQVPSGALSRDHELRLRSPWAAQLGWESHVPMCGAARVWNQSLMDAATYKDFSRACKVKGDPS